MIMTMCKEFLQTTKVKTIDDYYWNRSRSKWSNSNIRKEKVNCLFDMPVMAEGKKNKRQLNSAQLVHILKNNIKNFENSVVVVEQVNAMPGQGVTSMFNFGQTFGAIKGVCAALGLPICFVRPSKWKKHFELINSSKDASRTKAIQIYPGLSNQLSKKRCK